MTIEGILASGIAQMNLPVDSAAQMRLIEFLRLVEKWNKVHNLTAIRGAEQMVTLHLLDSLSLVPHLGAARKVLDVGSGAGLPGVPLAIANPNICVTAIDSSHKKAAFLRQAVAELKLANLHVACERVERWQPQEVFDLVVSRAFSDLADFVILTHHLLAPGGRWLAMKGMLPKEEISRLPESHRLERVVGLQVPKLEAQRHLVILKAA